MRLIKYLVVIFSAILLILCGFYFGFLASKSHTPSQTNYHYSPITQKEYFDDFFAQADECKNAGKPKKGVIVNHHLLAGKFIAQGLCSIATDKKITIVLISPNHFNHGGPAIISNYDWQTPYGVLQSDKLIIEKLSKANTVTIDEQPFVYEHGIYNIIPFIKKSLPNAKIVPVTIEDNISSTQKQLLINSLQKILPQDAIIVASLDFSHYLTSDKADLADEQTLDIVNNFDLNKIKDLNPKNNPDNVDSKPTLEILLSLMSSQNAKFNLLAHSNSAKLIGDLNIPETTSYIVGHFSSK